MENVKLIIIGAGPAGYVGAIRAAQLGLDPVLVEKEHVGGTCLNWGCIPTKALVRAAHLMEDIHGAGTFGITADASFSWPDVVAHARDSLENNRSGVEFLLKKNGVRRVTGTAVFTGEREITVCDAVFRADHIVIAAGSLPKHLPHIQPDGSSIISSREALFLDELPASITIVGGGVIGCEFAYIFNAFGVSVTIVEAMKRLVPAEDRAVSRELLRSFKKAGITVHKKCMVNAVGHTENGVFVTLDNGKSFETETVLSAVGRKPRTDTLGLDAAGIAVNEHSFIPVNSSFMTNVSDVYAVGDVINTPMLAHTAEHEAVHAVEHIAGVAVGDMNYRANPGCIYCEPEIASMGMTEEEVKSTDIEYTTGKCPFKSNGKAITSGDIRGFVKVIVEKETGKLLGVHIIGQHATDIISEFLPAFSRSLTVHEMLDSIHPHPTRCEASKEAMLDALGRALHL